MACKAKALWGVGQEPWTAATHRAGPHGKPWTRLETPFLQKRCILLGELWTFRVALDRSTLGLTR